MRIPKIENYKNDKKVVTRKISDIITNKRQIVIKSDKDKVKFIKSVEKVVRGSFEYKEYIGYLKQYVDMTKCSFFTAISNKESRKVSIEIHHEPFTLFDICQIVVEKWVQNEWQLNPILIADEVLRLHYRNMVGLIPVSVTVHQLIHDGKLLVPLQNVRGGFVPFFDEYEPYINDELKDLLQTKLNMSQDIANHDTTILATKFVYLEVDGMTFPQPIAEKGKK